jgi:hypothetical protein
MRRFAFIIALAVVLAAFQTAPATESGNAEVSDELRAALKAPIGKKIKQLLEKKDDLGASYVYGSYYDDFTKVGDGYEVTFITRTSMPEELITERYTLTLKKEGSGWQIADERLEHRVDGILFRSTPWDENFYKFDSFAFDREGLKLSGGAGDLVVDYRRGEPFRLWFVSSNTRYDYMTPFELGWYSSVLKRQLKKFPKEIIFPVEHITIYCTPDECKEFMSSIFVGLRDSSVEQAEPYVRTEYNKFMKELDKNRKEYPLAGFQPIDRPGVRTWSVIMKKAGREHLASLAYDNEARHEMKFAVTALGDRQFYGFPLFVYNSEETRNSDVDPYELERRDDIYTSPNGRFTLDYDIIGLTGAVQLAVKDDEMMSCDFTYELEAKRDLEGVPFVVATAPRLPGEDKPAKKPTLNVFAMEDGDGNDLTYIRLGKTSGLIVFPEIVPAGERFKIHVKFDNGNSIYKHNHSYSRVNRGGWAPFVSFTDNIDYLDLEITSDAKYEILGIDNKISEKVANGLRTERYKSDFPLTFPTIIFGVYESDSSKIQAKKLDGTPIPVNVYVDKTSMRTFTRVSGSGDDRIQKRTQTFEEQNKDIIDRAQADGNIGVRDIRKDALSPIGDQAANAINLYEDIFGVDYPFAKLDLVSDPLGSFYGQAPPSIVYLGYGVFYPTARVNVGSRGDISSFQNTVVAHELGHQWWGSAIVNKNFGNYWFVETLAEYSSALYSEALGRAEAKDEKKAAEKGWNEYMKNVGEWRRMLMDRPNLFSSVQHSDSMMPGVEPAARTAAIYNKGPYAFHMMRLLFGDEKFFPFLKTLAQEFEGKEIVTRDIQRVAEQSLCGVDDQGNPCSFDLEWFFDQWIRGIGMPEYSFNYTYRQAEDGTWIVEGDIKQRVVIGADKVPMPGEVFRGRTSVTVIDKNGEEYNVPVVIDAEVTPFAFKVPKEPLDILLNKNGGMLAHDVLVNRGF